MTKEKKYKTSEKNDSPLILIEKHLSEAENILSGFSIGKKVLELISDAKTELLDFRDAIDNEIDDILFRVDEMPSYESSDIFYPHKDKIRHSCENIQEMLESYNDKYGSCDFTQENIEKAWTIFRDKRIKDDMDQYLISEEVSSEKNGLLFRLCPKKAGRKYPYTIVFVLNTRADKNIYSYRDAIIKFFSNHFGNPIHFACNCDYILREGVSRTCYMDYLKP